MRSFITLALVGALALLSNPVLGEEELATRLFIDCVKQSLDGGLESGEIPDHNPFIVTRNLTIPINVAGTTGWVKIDHASIDDIIDFDVTHLKGDYLNDGKQIALDYKLYWKKMRVHGEYEAVVKVLHVETKYKGTLNLTLNELEFSGVWTMGTNPRHLDDFSIILKAETDFKVKGLGLLIDPVVSRTATSYINKLVNDPKTVVSFVHLLQERFNTLWLDDDHKYRIDAIIKNCKKPTL